MKTVVVLVAVAAAMLLLVAGTASAIGPRRLASLTPYGSSGTAGSGSVDPDMGPRRVAEPGFGVGIDIGPRR